MSISNEHPENISRSAYPLIEESKAIIAMSRRTSEETKLLMEDCEKLMTKLRNLHMKP